MIRKKGENIIDIREERRGRASDKKIKGIAGLLNFERNKLRKAEGIEQGKKGSSRRRRIRVIDMKVDVIGDDEFRGRRDEIFKKDRKISLESRH